MADVNFKTPVSPPKPASIGKLRVLSAHVNVQAIDVNGAIAFEGRLFFDATTAEGLIAGSAFGVQVTTAVDQAQGQVVLTAIQAVIGGVIP